MALRTMDAFEIITTFVMGDMRLIGINNDANLGLCEVEIFVEDDMLEMSTTYTVMAKYSDPQAEILRKLMI